MGSLEAMVVLVDKLLDMIGKPLGMSSGVLVNSGQPADLPDLLRALGSTKFSNATVASVNANIASRTNAIRASTRFVNAVTSYIELAGAALPAILIMFFVFATIRLVERVMIARAVAQPRNN